MPQIVVFGGTGPSGQCVIEEALSRNYILTIYARSPSKLPAEIVSSSAVTIIQGSLSDRDAISHALDGADAVLSTLGPSLSVKTAVNGLTDHGTPITDGYRIILDVMKEKGVKRLIALGTVSNTAEEDGNSLLRWGMVTAVWTFLHSAWRDVVELAKAIETSEGIDWTIARVGRLTRGEGGKVSAGYIGKGSSILFLARKDLARWYLDELEQRKWVHQLPVVYST
jgi:putative NADH-flavin reductase